MARALPIAAAKAAPTEVVAKAEAPIATAAAMTAAAIRATATTTTTATEEEAEVEADATTLAEEDTKVLRLFPRCLCLGTPHHINLTP